jgi:hypothetical protein
LIAFLFAAPTRGDWLAGSEAGHGEKQKTI